MNEQVCLRPNVMVEPLINQWYAAPLLVPPVSLALTIANSHLPVMRSFVAFPQSHVQALKNPAMIGGPFLDLDPSRVPEIRDLIASTEAQNADLLALAEAVKTLDRTLAADSSGMGLEALYPRLPEPLRGYVELRYDGHHHASMRFIERLLYASPFYKETAQSVALSLTDRDQRPFVYSTPRLPGREGLELRVPFRHGGLQALARSRYQPVSFGALCEQLSVRSDEVESFRAFFTETSPAPCQRYDGPGMRVRYFGHACILVETKDLTVLTDPEISYAYPAEVPRYTFNDLPERIDYVLITHTHSDHLALETLLQLKPKLGTVVVPRNNGGGIFDPSLKALLQRLGFKNVVDVDDLEVIDVPGGSITAIPFLGEHADLDIRSKSGYAIRFGDRAVMAVADSNPLEPKLYDLIREAVGPLDALFLGMESEGAPMSWGYGALFSSPPARKVDQSRRLNGANFDRAKEVVTRLRPNRFYNYAMGMEPWLGHVMGLQYTAESPQLLESRKMIDWCQQNGIAAERPFCRMELVLG